MDRNGFTSIQIERSLCPKSSVRQLSFVIWIATSHFSLITATTSQDGKNPQSSALGVFKPQPGFPSTPHLSTSTSSSNHNQGFVSCQLCQPQPLHPTTIKASSPAPSCQSRTKRVPPRPMFPPSQNTRTARISPWTILLSR